MNNSIRLQDGDIRLLRFYKVEYGLRSYSDAVRHAIQHAEGVSKNER